MRHPNQRPAIGVAVHTYAIQKIARAHGWNVPATRGAIMRVADGKWRMAHMTRITDGSVVPDKVIALVGGKWTRPVDAEVTT
jgi:hypothetical protein